jgi:hypothetical protein
MPKYRAEPGTEINGNDQQGNVWPKPFVFGKDGTLSVPDDQQDVVAALESAADAGAIKRAREPSSSSGKE